MSEAQDVAGEGAVAPPPSATFDDGGEDEALREIRLRVAAAFAFEPKHGGMFSPTSSVFGQYPHTHTAHGAHEASHTSTAVAPTQAASSAVVSVSPLNPDRVRVRAKGLRGDYSLDWAVEIFQPVLQSHGFAPTEENIAPGPRYSTLETKSKRWKNTYMVDFYISRQLYDALPMTNGEYLWHDGQGNEVVVKKYKRDKSAAREREKEERRKEKLERIVRYPLDDGQHRDGLATCDTDQDGGP